MSREEFIEKMKDLGRADEYISKCLQRREEAAREESLFLSEIYLIEAPTTYGRFVPRHE